MTRNRHIFYFGLMSIKTLGSGGGGLKVRVGQDIKAGNRIIFIFGPS